MEGIGVFVIYQLCDLPQRLFAGMYTQTFFFFLFLFSPLSLPLFHVGIH